MILQHKQNSLLPNRNLIKRYLNKNSIYIKEYYGNSWQDRIRSWIFRKRYSLVLKLISKYNREIKYCLDVGCGSMFIAHSIIKKFNADYVGIDIISSTELGKYARLIELSTGKRVNVIKATAEYLPFRNKVFDAALSLDVLEHLYRPQAAINEMNRVTGDNLIISLPLENTFQRIARFPIILSEGTFKDPTPEYHYVGIYKSYQEIWEKLLRKHIIKTEYAPFGMIETLNFYAIHLLDTSWNEY